MRVTKILGIAALAAACLAVQGGLMAQDAVAADAPGASCADQAVGKDGKKLSGAARASFIKKCEAGAGKASCEEKAVDKSGKKLAGAARTSFLKKCEADAKAAAK